MAENQWTKMNLSVTIQHNSFAVVFNHSDHKTLAISQNTLDQYNANKAGAKIFVKSDGTRRSSEEMLAWYMNYTKSPREDLVPTEDIRDTDDLPKTVTKYIDINFPPEHQMQVETDQKGLIPIESLRLYLDFQIEPVKH